MRFFIVLLMVFTVHMSIAAEIPTRINDKATASKSVSPDVMKSNLTITYTVEDFKTASIGIEKIATIINAHSSTCSFSSYQISPKYSYSNNTRNLEGYSAKIMSPCSFSNISEFDKVLNDLDSVTAANKSYVTSISPVQWTVSENVKDEIHAELKIKVLSEIDIKRVTYGEALSRKCYTTYVTYRGATPPPNGTPMLARSSAESFQSTPPDKNNEDISISADFTLLCK